MEAELEAEAKQAAIEKAALGEDDDHDTRKLKFPDRMKKVQSNKTEGTELFKDGNYKMAGARYNKALTHAAKVFDLSPDQQKEVNAVKLSLNLNMAQCYIKLENWDKVVMHSEDALKIDKDSTKALYRRAMAYEKTNEFDKAKADLKTALKIAPDDKAIGKLMVRCEAQIKRALAKEKKMYAKMFAKK
jgi:tetratricopeptide (TPR) repeat protein